MRQFSNKRDPISPRSQGLIYNICRLELMTPLFLEHDFYDAIFRKPI
jgi:hypothetical protein